MAFPSVRAGKDSHGLAICSIPRESRWRASRSFTFDNEVDGWPGQATHPVRLLFPEEMGDQPMTRWRRCHDDSAGLRRLASAKIRPDALRVLTTAAVASTPRCSNWCNISAALSRCACHSRLVGLKPGWGRPKLLPQTRAIMSTYTGACAFRDRCAVKSKTSGNIGAPSEARRMEAGAASWGSGGSGDGPQDQRRANSMP